MRNTFMVAFSLLLACGTGWRTKGNELLAELVVEGDVLIRWPRQFHGIAVIPDEVHHIAEHAFSDCRNLTGVVFPRHILSIGSFSFERCHDLTQVELPESITRVGEHAFYLCCNMTNMVVNATIYDVPHGMCNRCVRLEHVTLPKILRSVGEDAFRGCRSLRNVTIPAGVTNISAAAFAACSNLERVALPERLERLGDKAFGWCYNLRQVNLPKSLRELGSDVFIDKAMAVNAVTNATADIAGLAKVVRFAADGFSMEGDGCHVDLFALDRFAAHLNEIHLGMSFRAVEDFVRRLGFGFGHGAEIDEASNVKINRSTYIKFGTGRNGAVNLCLEYDDDKVSRITLSEAFKLGSKIGMMKSKEAYCERDVLQWL